MAIKPLTNHYSMETPLTVYDEEALTALQLVGRTAAKVNEIVEDQNTLHRETVVKMAEQDDAIAGHGDYMKTEIPKAVTKEVNKQIQEGTFDRAISHYASDLETRLNNFMENTPDGSTTMDAEVVDIRIDERGFRHATAGAAVRAQTERALSQLASSEKNHGVYVLPVIWKKSSDERFFVCEPVAIPADGVSVRVSESGAYVCNGKDCKLITKIKLGYMVNGEFTYNEDLTTVYGTKVYSNRIKFIPYMAGVYMQIEASLLSDSTHQMSAATIDNYAHLLELVRPYTGKIKSGGNLLGSTTCTVVTSGAGDAGYFANWSLRQLVWKYCCVSSPLPLQFVDRVTCNPNIWITAKVFKFDPVTRVTEWYKTLHFNSQNPCFGSECCIDFSEYGENFFATLLMGYVPTGDEYDATSYADKTAAPLNVTKCGLNTRSITDGVHVEWNAETQRKDSAGGTNYIVQRNIELLKTLKHKTVAAKYGHDNSSDLNYILGQDDFAGAFYGGAYTRGAVFYNVSPAAYFAALLNPNSNAYGDNDINECGARYGLQCSNFVSVCHGYPLPLSTFDYRYNDTIPFFDRVPFNMDTDIDKIRTYDILTQGEGETGHTIMATGVGNVGDIFTYINIMESSTPSTRENVLVLHNGAAYYKSAAETWYKNAYDYLNTAHREYDQTIHDKANWIAPYTDPQKVMCSRGYGSVYVLNKNKVILSVAPDVNEITITRNGSSVGKFVVGDVSNVTKNGYALVDITANVGAGVIRVHNDIDDSVEEFYIIDPTGYTVTADLDAETVTVYTNKPDEAKYVNLLYCFGEGDHVGDLANMNFLPDFDSSGKMVLPAYVDTKYGRADLVSSGEIWEDRVNVVFKTAYDTNTFAVDAQGDTFN